MKVAAFHFSQWFNSPCLPEGGSVKTWDDGRGRRRINGGQTIHRIHRYLRPRLSLSRRNTRFLLLFIVVVNAVVGRHKMEVLIAQPRAQGEDGMGPSSVRGHRSFGISPGDGGGGGSEVRLLLLRLRSRLISAAAASLSVLVHICVRLSWWKSVLVRSFSISFGLSALFVFNCSILFFLPPSLHLLLPLPFLRPIRHHWQLGGPPRRARAPALPSPPSCLKTP